MNNREKERELSFTQSDQQNEELFVERLMRAGWTRREAQEEWENIQRDDEDGML